MVKTYRHTVPVLSGRIRCSDYLIEVFPGMETKSAVKKALKKSMITVEGEMAATGTWIKGGEKVVYTLDSSEVIVWEKTIKVHYEDEYLAIVEKPAGIPTSGNQFNNLRNTLPYNLEQSLVEDALLQPEPVHRLDRATSGLLLAAKT